MQEIGFALANAIAILDAIRERGIPQDEWALCRPRVVLRQRRHPLRRGDVKMRAFAEMWDELTRDRYGVNPKHRLFRYGVQVSSLGLTEEQPENNAWRILLEALG